MLSSARRMTGAGGRRCASRRSCASPLHRGSATSPAALKIVDVDFEGQPFARGVKDEAKAALRTLCLPHLEYSLIWRRPLHRLPVHKDVPRLLKGLLVVGADGSEMYREDGSARPAEPHTVIAALRSLMLTLARHLDALSVVALIEEKLDVFLPPNTGDVAGGLRHFLLESGIPEHSLFVLIFKAIHQEMIFPAVSRCDLHLWPAAVQGHEGQWKVRIDLRTNEIRISHSSGSRRTSRSPRCSPSSAGASS